jgi:ATP-dependent Lon protease
VKLQDCRHCAEGDDAAQRETAHLRKRIKEAKMPTDAEKETLKELTRFPRMSPASREYTISRAYPCGRS